MSAKLRGWMVVSLLFGTMAYAIAEEVVLTTYYPSPKGVYKALRVTDDVGIGTTAPDDKLHVKDGSGRFGIGNQFIRLGADGNSCSGGPCAWITSPVQDQPLAFFTGDASAGALLERMRITSAGNVGIGTTEPGALLHLVTNNPDDSGGIRMERTSATTGRYNQYISSSGDLTFSETAVGTRITLQKTTGNVGIGTTSPSSPLHILSTADPQVKVAYDATNYTTLRQLSNGNFAINTNTGGIYFQQAGLSKGYWDGINWIFSAGKVGIGTTSPAWQLTVDTPTTRKGGGGSYGLVHTDSDQNVSLGTWIGGTLKGSQGCGVATLCGAWLGTITNHPLYFFANSSNVQLMLDTNGNVGIGAFRQPGHLAPPSEKLDVIGNVHATGWVHGEQEDLAEEFTVGDPSIEAGDVVSLDLTSQGGRIVKTTAPYQALLLGVVSERPGLRLGKIERSDDPEKPSTQPLALAGRIPVKVCLENGPIAVGDYLTSSSIPGVAMKAIDPGPVIGIALETFDGSGGEIGKAMCFVTPGEERFLAEHVAKLHAENTTLQLAIQALQAKVNGLLLDEARSD